MTFEDFQQQLDQWWSETDAREVARKNSQEALLQLMKLYSDFGPDERKLADRVLAEWATSDNRRKRFDATAMIDHFGIRSALPALRSVASMLETQDDHEAPFELSKTRRVISRLEE